MRERSGARARACVRALEQEGFDLHQGDVLRPETLRRAGQSVEVAYYLIHSMGRGSPEDFHASEPAAAAAFARMARTEGIEPSPETRSSSPCTVGRGCQRGRVGGGDSSGNHVVAQHFGERVGFSRSEPTIPSGSRANAPSLGAETVN